MNRVVRVFKYIVSILVFIFTIEYTGKAVYAEDVTNINHNQNGSITIIKQSGEDWPVVGSVFHLYYVAQLNDKNVFTYTSDFSHKYALPSANQIPDSSWSGITYDLKEEVKKSNISPYLTERWGYGNALTFNNLPVGLYLITSEDTVITNNDKSAKKIVSQGNLVSIPNKVSEEDNWNYDVTIEEKYDEEAVPPSNTIPPTTPTPTPTSPSSKITPTPITTSPKPLETSGRHGVETGISTGILKYVLLEVGLVFVLIGIIINRKGGDSCDK